MATMIEEVLSKWQGIDWSKPENAERNANAARLLQVVDWGALSQLASDLNGNRSCRVIDPYTLGGHHMIRAIQFEDGTFWVARLAMDHDGGTLHTLAEAEAIMQREEDIMRLVKYRTDVPVPYVFANFTKAQTMVGAPVMFMEFCLGNAVMDLSFDYVPDQYKSKFIADLADIQVQLSTLTFDKIGSIVARPDGTYAIGPLPGIGGPFDTTSEFLAAWFARCQFRHSDKTIIAEGGYYSEQMAERIHHFRDKIMGGAYDNFEIKNNNGPFVLKHIDLGQNNIVIDYDYNITGIVDWEHAFSAPLLLAEMPKMFAICPDAMGVPNRGLPASIRPRQRLADRQEYLGAVRRAESKYGSHRILSEALADHRAQEIGAALRMYHDPGHLAWYCSFLPVKQQLEGWRAAMTRCFRRS